MAKLVSARKRKPRVEDCGPGSGFIHESYGFLYSYANTGASFSKPTKTTMRFKIEGVDVCLPLNAQQREKIEKIDESDKRRNSMEAKLERSGARDLDVDLIRGKVYFHVDRLHLASRVCRKLGKILAPRKKRKQKKA